jgi:ubiquinone/menaquinone biosynthesis C-methylase UbiE
MRPVEHDRDVAVFGERAAGYENGWRGQLHHDIADRAVELALSVSTRPRRVLDVGCGTGYLLRQLVARTPEAVEVIGVDAAPAMVRTARAMASDSRIRFATAVAERLPYPDETL